MDRAKGKLLHEARETQEEEKFLLAELTAADATAVAADAAGVVVVECSRRDDDVLGLPLWTEQLWLVHAREAIEERKRGVHL